MAWILQCICGGLDPKTAHPVELRRRATVGTVVVSLFVASLLVLPFNSLVGDTAHNPAVVVGLLIGAGLFAIHASGRWPRLAGHGVVASTLLGILTPLIDTGMDGPGWSAALVVPVVATIVTRGWGGLVWSAATAVAMVAVVGLIHAGVLPHPENAPSAGNLTYLANGLLLLGFVTGLLQLLRLNEAYFSRALHRTVEELESEVTVRRTAEEEARHASTAKSEFLATMSHEIRTPMNGVLGATELLGGTVLLAHQRELVDTIESSADLLLALINDVLDLSRLESGRVQLERLPVHVATHLRRILSPVQVQAERKGLSFSIDVAPDVPEWQLLDPTRLGQIVLNLASNAVKFTTTGAVTVVVTAEGDVLALAVKDTGIGILPSDLDRLFQPFVQAEASTTRRYGGSGLGLSIVRHLATAMDGGVSANSVAGAGSVFTVRIPLLATEEPSNLDELTHLSEAPAGGRELHVLAVDDNPVNRMVVQRMLQTLGAEVTVATDGDEALELMEQTRFDMVFMDVHMPRLDGLETTRRLRARGDDVMIVGLSAAVQRQDRSNALDAGMNDFLTKPVRLPDLKRALNRLSEPQHKLAS